MNYSVLSLLVFVILFFLMLKNRFKALCICLVLFPTLDMFKLSGSFPVWGCINILLLFSLFIKRSRQIAEIPFKKPLCFSLISYILSFLFGQYNNLGGVMNFIQYLLFIPLIWYLYMPSKECDNFIIKTISVYMICSVLYGCYEAFTFSKPFMTWLLSIGAVIEYTGEGAERLGLLRTSSFTPWFTYFACSCICSYSLLTAFIDKSISSKRKYIILCISFLCILGVVVTMDRTAMVVVSLILLGLNYQFLRQDKSIFLIVLIAGLITYNYFGQFFDDIIYTITHSESSDVTGSSLSMRISQLNAAYHYVENNLIFGKGLNAIGVAVERIPDLLGGESLLFYVLINRGIVGIFSLLLLLGYVFFFLMKRKCYSIIVIFVGLTLYNFITLPIHEFYALPFIILLYKRKMYVGNNDIYATKK